MKDPLYNIECEISDESPSEFYCFRLAEHAELSYCLHRELLNNPNAFPIIRKYNDLFHQANSTNKFLSYCISPTIFMNNNDDYITLDDVINYLKEMDKWKY